MSIRVIEDTRNYWRNWREWDIADWMMTVFILPLMVLIVSGVLLLIVAGVTGHLSSENAVEGDTRVQRYDCTWQWSPATKTSMRTCGWETLEYER